MKKILFTSIALLSVCFISSCKKEDMKKTQDEPITLVMAEVNPEDSICGLMDQAFKEKVEALSNGNIKIDLRCSGILGDEKQVMGVILGENSSIHLTRISASLAKYGGKKSTLLSIPYTFANADHFWKFANSELAEELLNEAYELKLGVKGLCFAEEGFRHFFCTEKISGIEDMKGKRMRVSGQVLTDLAKSLESVPLDIPFTDVYLSLQTGKVDVAEQPISNYLKNSFHKVAPNLILDGHMLGAVQILIDSETWDSLSENQQKIFTEAAKYASNFCKNLVAETESKIIAQLKAEGVNVVEVSDITPWQTACKDMIANSAKDFPDLYSKIVNFGK